MKMQRWAQYYDYLITNFDAKWQDDQLLIGIKTTTIIIDQIKQKWRIDNYQNYSHQRCFDLTKGENWSLLILVLKLLNHGYLLNEIILEKEFKLGHKNGYVDLAISDGKQNFALIEVKNFEQYQKVIDYFNHPEQTKQLFSYLQQDKNVQLISYYTFDLKDQRDYFATVIVDQNLTKTHNLDDLIKNWNGCWNATSIFDFQKFKIGFKALQDQDLIALNPDVIKVLFHQFLTILRQYCVSDKGRAFDKLINIFIAKVVDEISGNCDYEINGFKIKQGLQFQWVEGVDDYNTFLNRIKSLYQKGMRMFLNQSVNDYDEDYLDQLLKDVTNKAQIKDLIDQLCLKKDQVFDLIDLSDHNGFKENGLVLKAIVQLLEKYRFKYTNKFQYLGDWFEELLNTSWKQEAGQFFSPMPIVDFMVNSLPIKEYIDYQIANNEFDILPKMIDYACGSGHFIISFIDVVQQIINQINDVNNQALKQQIAAWKINPYSWTKDRIVGIEKDYRLAKTTKVATFLNGDGQATIINGDGIACFKSADYQNSILASQKRKNESFDFLITNPPFAVDGFLKSLAGKIDENDFSLLKTLNPSSGRIEILFVERMWQLLKVNGIGAIILPQAILSAKAYQPMREFIFKHFQILTICCFGDQTFSGTTTSPVILFLRKRALGSEIDEQTEVLIINSPKMLGGSSQAEKVFLGYEFSSNRNKLGITYLNDHLKTIYSQIVKQWIATGKISQSLDGNKYIKIRKLKTIFVRQNEYVMIYPNKSEDKVGNWQNLATLGFKVNQKVALEANEQLNYIEIGDLNQGQIKIKSFKNKQSQTVCNAGDLLISALTPSKTKIAIAKQKYYLSPAIFAISHQDPQMIEWLFQYLMTDEVVFNDIKGLLDGFKITYAKLSRDNLVHQVYFKID